jgi:hypothetical protein
VGLNWGFVECRGRTRSRVHCLRYAGIMTLPVLVTLDQECARMGTVRVDAADVVRVAVRQRMKWARGTTPEAQTVADDAGVFH